MSIKRSARVSSGPRRDDGGVISFNKKKDAKVELTWDQHMEGKSDEQFKPYSTAGSFSVGDLLMHKVFGKGVVMGLQDRRIEVLFAMGEKMLACNPS